MVCLVVVMLVCSALAQRGATKERQTGRLLVVPMDGSHWTGLKAVAEEMGRRGHSVLVLIPEVSMRLDSGKHYSTKKFAVPYKKDLINKITAGITHQLSGTNEGLIERVSDHLNHIMTIMNFMLSTSESIFFNEELMEFLRKEEFDAVLTDPVMPTGAILAFNLSLPAVYMLRGMPCGMDAKATGCPDPPSYVPRFYTKHTDRMCFSERVVNTLVYFFEPVMCKLFCWQFEDVASRFMQRSVNLMEILNTAAVWLLRSDFTMEFPKPLAPNMVLIGGLNCAVSSPLEPDLLKFVEEAEHGIIVFSLGTLVPKIPEEKAAIFFQAFSRIPQRVLWRYTGKYSEKVPDNVKLMNWIPQNDLLGHPNTRAFITHGGTHGIYEGICHGVPMLMMPLFGDQGDNVHRTVSRGVGVALNFYNITVDVLLDALHDVINNSSYKERMMKLSALHNDRPVQPLDLAVYWTEYVMRHKSTDHLRLAGHDLYWFQYHSLDVIAFLLVVVVIVITAMIKCCAVSLRCCRKLQKRKQE
ncbi:UDP-glucuronosyltransferase 1A1-like [Trichomycterus rosablanca]|uniref:UDP-glucuronosyltransferase 1A1-like n=1 Tax=Trichomycterus rosablanca TaxID=2290929 RepID=UPI002F35EC8D